MGLPFRHTDDELRNMYAGGRANGQARRYARFWAAVFRSGLLPRRWVTLEVVGRKSGVLRRFPLGMATVNAERYLVSMLGEDCNWVANVRGVDGRARLLHVTSEPVQLIEVPVAQRPSLIKAYLEQVPGARPHIPVDRQSDIDAFLPIGARYPVFRVTPRCE
jgi:F420H(2)-dependent quinone reductase